MFYAIIEKIASWNEKRIERKEEIELKKAHPDVQLFVKKYGKDSA